MSQPVSQRFPQVDEDHRQLIPMITELEQSRDPEDIRRRLETLRPWLERHFEEEEQPNGMFESIERVDPRHSQDLKSLVHEHHAMIEQVGQLAELAKATEAGQPLHQQLINSVRDFVHLVREHEIVENQLLVEAFYHEEGGGD